MAHQQEQAPLLELPDPCLLLVLACLADDPASVCSAARAHSMLHQAAVMVLSSVKVTLNTQQKIDGSLLPYLAKHGQQVRNLQLSGDDPASHNCRQGRDSVSLRQLPPGIQVASLQVSFLDCNFNPTMAFMASSKLACRSTSCGSVIAVLKGPRRSQQH